MKVLLCVLVALFATCSLQQQATPVQAFIIGLHNGVNLGANNRVIALVTNDQLNLTQVAVNLAKAGSDNRFQRIAGIDQLYAAFYSFAQKAYNIISLDANFTLVFNYTLTLLSNSKDFIARADKYQSQTKFDVFTRVAQAANLAKAGDFYNAGANFGWVILQLANTRANLLLAEQRGMSRLTPSRFSRFAGKRTN
eukprot:TRINITY_DN1277_c0_g1_i2.p1 TRINITY_DN1277_c0_g1~~TRINITY_DN1277_c0_g1_i2.p1  ORF type:complete len:195 (-),score=55.73 TRINITY_DN1277_c0_g1_i2:50-634(-)